MKFSLVWVPATPTGKPERFKEVIEECVLAEELGYDRVWLTEHHFTEYGRPSNQVLAAHVAAKTERIRIGLAVVVLPFHHPLHVAEDIVMLDHLSDGRVDFGVGRGNQPLEFAGFGVDMDEGYQRHWESLDIIKKAWTQESVSYDGKFWKFPDITLLPKPVQQPHPPIWQVGVSQNSIKLAAEKRLHGLIGTFLNTLEGVQQDMELWHQTLAEVGVPEETLLLAHNEFVYVAETDEEAKRDAEDGAMWYSRMAGKLWSSKDEDIPEQYKTWRGLAEQVASLEWDDLFHNRSFMGSPETVLKKVELLRSWNVDELLLFTGFGTLAPEKIKKSMRLFAQEVMPAFREDERSAEREGSGGPNS